jgi:hypothetical protein
MMRKVLVAATWIVWLHVLVVILHSVAHLGEHVLPATFFDYAFVFVVIIAAPVVALFLLNNAHLSRLGALLLFLSMLGSLLYGLVNHFLLPGADNATQMSPGGWQLPFLVTSYLLLILEAAGSVVGLWALFVRKDYQTT